MVNAVMSKSLEFPCVDFLVSLTVEVESYCSNNYSGKITSLVKHRGVNTVLYGTNTISGASRFPWFSHA